MNCFESRRALLIEPRNRSGDLGAHLASCDACTHVAERLAKLDRDVAEAASVPLPDALAERILLARQRQPHRQNLRRIEAQVDSLQAHEAAHEKTGACQQRDGQRDFGDDEGLA